MENGYSIHRIQLILKIVGSEKIEWTCSTNSVILYNVFALNPHIQSVFRVCAVYIIIHLYYYVYGNSIQSNAVPIIEL